MNDIPEGGRLKSGWQKGIRHIRERDEDEKAMEGLTPLECFRYALKQCHLALEECNCILQRMRF